MNQYDMLSCVMADDKLFSILENIYSKEDDVSSVRLYLRAPGHIGDKSLYARKKELQKTLNARKKELSLNIRSGKLLGNVQFAAEPLWK